MNIANLPDFSTQEVQQVQKYVQDYARRTVPREFVAQLFGIEMTHLNFHTEKLGLAETDMLCPADVTIITLRLTGEPADARVHEHVKGVSDLFYAACDIDTEPDSHIPVPRFKVKFDP